MYAYGVSFSLVHYVSMSSLVWYFAILDRLSTYYHETFHEILLFDTNGILVPTIVLYPDWKAKKRPLRHVVSSYYNHHTPRLQLLHQLYANWQRRALLHGFDWPFVIGKPAGEVGQVYPEGTKHPENLLLVGENPEISRIIDALWHYICAVCYRMAYHSTWIFHHHYLGNSR